MITIQEIQQTILVADSYYQELIEKKVQDLENGCATCDSCLVKNIYRLTEQLSKLVSIELLTETTLKLFECLKSAIINYSGVSMAVDPHAQIPGYVIDVYVPEDNRPDPVLITWDDMVVNGALGRTKYINSQWTGFNPFLAFDNADWLRIGIDYTVLANGGFELLPNGNVPFIYEGQEIRAVNYEPYSV